MNLHPDPSRG